MCQKTWVRDNCPNERGHTREGFSEEGGTKLDLKESPEITQWELRRMQKAFGKEMVCAGLCGGSVSYKRTPKDERVAGLRQYLLWLEK